MRGAGVELAAVRALAADTRLADEHLAADVVQAVLELVQLGVHARQPGQLRLAQATVRLVLDVVSGAVDLVDEATEVAQQQFARGAQEGDPAAQLAAAGAGPGGGGELVGVKPGGQVGDRLERRTGAAGWPRRRGPARPGSAPGRRRAAGGAAGPWTG